MQRSRTHRRNKREPTCRLTTPPSAQGRRARNGSTSGNQALLPRRPQRPWSGASLGRLLLGRCPRRFRQLHRSDRPGRRRTHPETHPEQGKGYDRDQLVGVATDGSEAIWAEIIAWEPPDWFELSPLPGQDAASASTVIVSFEPDGNRTRVVIEHRGWESFGSDAPRRRRGYVGPNAWGSMLDHYGAEARIGAVDLTALAD